MSNMQFESTKYGAKAIILKRNGFEGIPLTLDFTNVNAEDDFDRIKVVRAGTPIGADGVVNNTSSVMGILLFDVREDRPQGTLLKKAYIDTQKALISSGIAISSEAKAALPMIVFE